MTTQSQVEVVRELPAELPLGWQWRPRWRDDGEAQRLLQRYADRGLPETAREEVRGSALDILARCVPPNNATDRQETGLVVGYVQSGKTLSFTTVAALACDNRFPLIIVLSGTKTNLYNQTVKRLRRDLDLDESPAGRWRIFEARTRNPDLSQQLGDLLEQWDQPELEGFPHKTAIITVLKNRQRVDGLVDALRQLDLRGRQCLIIDDEADQHGLNTRVKQGETSAVYSSLLSLRAALPGHTYVQYTATPQALLLISVLDSLSPEFGWVIAAGEGYTGGAAFFEEDGGTLVRTIPDDDLHVMLDEGDGGPPETLLEAMRLFFVGVAVQAFRRGQSEPTEQYRSMLVHPSMRQLDHLRCKRWVDAAKASWIELLEPGHQSPDRDELVQDFRSAYDELAATAASHVQRNSAHESFPAFERVLEYLRQSMLTTATWEVNSRDFDQWTQDNWPSAHSHILVGGENLGRGFTVEGLTVTYMPRGRGTGVADTIQQRGRFFGYKRNYLGLCRVFLEADVRSDYEHYIDHESHVMGELDELAQSGKPMSEWRRRMLLEHSLRPTRRSVLPDIYRHLRVSDWTQQSQPWIRDEDAEVAANWDVIEDFYADLQFVEAPGSAKQTQEQRSEIASVPARDVLEKLLIPLWFSWRDRPSFSALEVAIEWHLRKKNANAVATVYRMASYSEPLSGGGTRQRRLDEHDRIRELFQGNDPATEYPGDRRIRAEKELTVQIHNLDLTNKSRQLERGHVPTIAVWVPDFMRVGVFDEMAT